MAVITTSNTTVKDPKQQFEQDSVWYFKRREFKEFIETISDQSVNIKSVLHELQRILNSV